MTAPSDNSTSPDINVDIATLMAELGQKAKQAAHHLGLASSDTKNAALRASAKNIRDKRSDILKANAQDLDTAGSRGLASAMLDRLMLDPDRIEAMAKGLEDIADLPDPIGTILDHWQQPSGLDISRVRVPLGVIGIIYEARPNVTADAGALCLKSGNAAILRGGSESFHSARAIHACLVRGLTEAGLPPHAIQLVPTTDRACVGQMLGAMTDTIDVIIPRGGKSLIARVQSEARVPVLAHLEGICHVYIDKAADLEKAVAVTLNAKMRRTGICGAAETLLIDKACLASHLTPVLDALAAAGCALRGDDIICALDQRVEPVTEDDWGTEYLDAILSVRAVDGVGEAIEHIAKYGSHHTETIITQDADTANRFLAEIDSAIVMHNASTQFADGGEFGMGAEIGIATGKLHARGPVGANELTSYKYVVRGDATVRP